LLLLLLLPVPFLFSFFLLTAFEVENDLLPEAIDALLRK